MEFYPLMNNEKKIRELYYLSFTGTHFEFVVDQDDWRGIIERIGNGTPFALRQEADYIPPSGNAPWGIEGCCTVNVLLNGRVSLTIPAVPAILDTEGPYAHIQPYARTIVIMTKVLSSMLYEISKDEDACVPVREQLFHTQTVLFSGFHGASLDLTVSHTAAEYLASCGEEKECTPAVRAMRSHYHALFLPDEELGYIRRGIDVVLRTKGLLHLNTVGDCACMGAIPQHHDDKGYYLSSHNVDGAHQQFNLLVGIASLWNMVREGRSQLCSGIED